MFKLILIVGTGSFIGGASRFILSRYVQNHSYSSFPFGTFTVNIIGCLLIGILMGLSERNSLMNNELRIFLTVGFCGGFTTFSTFAGDNISLLRDGNFIYFALYAGFSVFCGLLAAYLGNILIKML